jgi:hypothetical protein
MSRPATTGTVFADPDRLPSSGNDDRSSDFLADELARQQGEDLAALDYHAQAGCPREYGGCSYRPNVAGPSAPPPPVNPRPFKLR